MDLGLQGLNAIVTGATRGIGRAIADTLADEGANVAICARHADDVAAAVTALQAKGVRATGRALDVADGPALQEWVRDTAGEFGGIDIVVSNVSALAIGGGTLVVVAAFAIGSISLGWLTLRLEAKR